MSEEQKELQKQELSLSARFMNKVMSEFTSGVGEIALTNFQKRLAQNYFIAINGALQSAEQKRLKRRESDREKLPVLWANVNMEGLAQSVVACARIGLDPAQRNHIAMMPFKNNHTNKYDIVFIEGYRGIELKATKYGLNIPDQVVVELVYSTDKFKSIKKSSASAIDTYSFEITNDFNRGEVIGGFYYHIFNEHPEKNRLVVMTLKDILKRRPKYASPEFWGGEKDAWKEGKKVGKETVEGWFDQMAYKTVYRAAYGSITIDSQKIDDDFMRLRQLEDLVAKHNADAEIDKNANAGPIIDIKDEPSEDPPLDAEFTEGQPESVSSEQPQQGKIELDEAPY